MPTRTDGRQLNVDVEASTPLGRQVHALEGVAYTGSQQAVYYRNDRDSRLHHDMRADLHVAAIASEAQRMLARGGLSLENAASLHLILADAQGYWRADEAEDAAAESGDGRVETMHSMFKRIAGWVEKVCAAIRKAVRKDGGR